MGTYTSVNNIFALYLGLVRPYTEVVDARLWNGRNDRPFRVFEHTRIGSTKSVKPIVCGFKAFVSIRTHEVRQSTWYEVRR
jgi:hypothetical protein